MFQHVPSWPLRRLPGVLSIRTGVVLGLCTLLADLPVFRSAEISGSVETFLN